MFPLPPLPPVAPLLSLLLRSALFALALLLAPAFLPAPAFALPAPPSDAAWAALPPHPRLFANPARFAALQAQTDEVTLQLRALLAHQAARKLDAKPINYPPTGFLMGPAREAQGRILACALTCRLTGDKAHLERARSELLILAAMPEWRPSHFLGVGEAALAAGVGYDWLYEELTPDERDRVVRAVVANAIRPCLETPDGPKSWVRADFNWTQVCHGGVTVAALAIAERETALARQVIERTVANFDRAGASYSPDGSHAEGPSYRSYGTSFHVILVDALRTALGTDCGLEEFPGFLKTDDFNNRMVGPTGEEYNYSDYHTENLHEPIMLWFARENRDRSLARDELADLARAHATISAAAPAAAPATPARPIVLSRHLALELLWWDPTLPAGVAAPARHWTAAGVLPLSAMRSAWDDPTASFLAIKGGTPTHSHAHMDVGSFILEADGVRWALDLGTESYGKMRAAKLDLWNYTQHSNRWTTSRVGPEGHNILRFDGAYQNVAGKADIRALPEAPDGTMGNVVELSPQWHTKARVTRTPDGLRLGQAGQSLALRIEVSPTVDAPLGLATAGAIVIEDVSAARATQDSANPGLSRIVITPPTAAHATARLRLTATPGPR